MSKSGETVDPVRAAADILRGKKGLEYSQAKLELVQGEEGERVEYFRGKDLVRFIEASPGKLNERPGRTPEESAGEIVRQFFSRGLLYRTERKYKRPKPGRTRLVKWPRTLLLVRDQQWDVDSFYAWRYERPTPIWYWLATVAIPLVVILACLFPLAPWWVRTGLVYTLMGLLIMLLSLLAVRYLVFAAVWALTGSALWIFPNMMSDSLGLLEAFKPVVSFKKSKSITDQWQARLATAMVIAGVLWVLASHSPDLGHLKEDVAKAHDSFREYMDAMYTKDKPSIAGTTGESASKDSA